MQDRLFYTGTWSFLPREGFLMAKKGLKTKNSHFVRGIHEFSACAIFLGLKFNLFSPKKSGDRNGSVEIRETPF